MKNILASALQIGDRVDGSILPELCQHPLAAHQLFTVCYVGNEGADLVHVEFEGRGPQRAVPGRVVPGSLFPPLFERNAVLSIAGLPDQCQHCGTLIEREIPYCSGQCYHDAHFN